MIDDEDALRQGPRPLPLHLAAAMMSSLSAVAALPAVRSGSMPWARNLVREAADLVSDMQAVDQNALNAAVMAEATRRLQAMIDGMETYQRHAYHRGEPEAALAFSVGNARLLDYGTDSGGAAILLVPSLVNRYYVLDLTKKISFARWLASQGFRPFVVDWGAPGVMEKDFSLTDYVTGHLFQITTFLTNKIAAQPHLLGYCMGGDLALALACLKPRAFASLSLLATPWNFHAAPQGPLSSLLVTDAILDRILSAFGEFPVDLLQALFAALDPNLAQRKFRNFIDLAGDEDATTTFVALEDWLNDGVPLTAGVARDCFAGWYARNEPWQGKWRIGDEVIRPQEITIPNLVAIPAHDRIVPLESALGLFDQLPAAYRLDPDAGHIGMMVGRQAEAALWRPIRDWLHGPAALAL
jgi:polyhydroxyalkanoate synthase